MLSFRHVVFYEVARHLSFSKAAQILNLSQPAISKNVKALEEQYKTSLFDRAGNTIALTDAGKILYETLSKARDLQFRLEYNLSTLDDEHHAKGELRLGASTTVALYILPEILSSFRKKYPGIRITLLNRNSENVRLALSGGQVDLGIIEGVGRTTTVNYKYFLSDDVVAVCSPESDLWERNSIALEELKQFPVALRERGSGTLASVKEALESHGLKLADLRNNIVLGGTEALKNFLLVDGCIGFLPLRSVRKELAAGLLKIININGLSVKRQFYFIQRHGSESDPLAQAFVRFALAFHNSGL